jgi:hypothetical protein
MLTLHNVFIAGHNKQTAHKIILLQQICVIWRQIHLYSSSKETLWYKFNGYCIKMGRISLLN